MTNKLDFLGHFSGTMESPLFDPELIRQYDKIGSPYTSYPTVDHFVEAYNARSHQLTLAQRGAAWGPAAPANTRPLALYVHIPFCETACRFCGCNKVITKNHENATKYLRMLEKEFTLIAGLLKGNRRADRLHLGGGTPTFLSIAQLQILMRALRAHFELAQGEYAIEIDPRTVDDEKIAALVQLGFNQFSLGVQDFDPDVQKAINRNQTEPQTANAVGSARKYGVTSLTIDLIYGLPKQNMIGFNRTLDQVLALRPDRIALYNYAHQPSMFKPQRRIHSADLPNAEACLQIMMLAVRKLTNASYDYIGLNHFALPHDTLSVATRNAHTHRNFHGASGHAANDLLAFGVSAISKIGTTYSQNMTTLAGYYDRLDRAELPVMRGIDLNADDLLRRAVIHSLMHHFELSIESIEIAHLINFRTYFADEWVRLEAFEREGFVTLEPDWISVTPRGRLLVSSIAIIFDRYVSRSAQRERASTII